MTLKQDPTIYNLTVEPIDTDETVQQPSRTGSWYITHKNLAYERECKKTKRLGRHHERKYVTRGRRQELCRKEIEMLCERR